MILEAKSFIPTRIETEFGCAGERSAAEHEVWTIDELDYLPATAQNRTLLEIDDWPTARIERLEPDDRSEPPDKQPIAKAPPMPVVDEE